ncbi:MAG: carboxylesterase/lipase family protein [Bacteroidales bacterium]|nr:carboxylesterase/lipase family protein [Bacteroidales bacterium]
MKRIIFIALASFAALLLSCQNNSNPVVKVEGGSVRGVLQEDVIIYRGIPFAAPPVGELQGKPLQDVQPWEGVLEADTFRAAAMQDAKDPNDPIYYREFFADGEPEYSEDCMYLNIWAPAGVVGKTDAKTPVAVWIHGGGFSQGYCFEKEMDGMEWAKRGVILVTIPYRLGAIGFNEQVGLLGLKDQIKALQWVRDNITAFGGDPSNVTIFGQSAGAMSCKYLHAFPEAQPLFARSIFMSGGGIVDMSWHPTLPFGTGGKDVPEYVEEGLYDTKPIMMGWVADDPGFLGEPTTAEFAKILAARTSERPIFVYAFNRDLPGEAEGEQDFGAFHSFELWYVFGTLDRSWRPFTEADYALSERMLDAWTNFAKSGNPGWEAATPEDIHVKVFDVE